MADACAAASAGGERAHAHAHAHAHAAEAAAAVSAASRRCAQRCRGSWAARLLHAAVIAALCLETAHGYRQDFNVSPPPVRAKGCAMRSRRAAHPGVAVAPRSFLSTSASASTASSPCLASTEAGRCDARQTTPGPSAACTVFRARRGDVVWQQRRPRDGRRNGGCARDCQGAANAVRRPFSQRAPHETTGENRRGGGQGSMAAHTAARLGQYLSRVLQRAAMVRRAGSGVHACRHGRCAGRLSRAAKHGVPHRAHTRAHTRRYDYDLLHYGRGGDPMYPCQSDDTHQYVLCVAIQPRTLLL